VLLGFSFFRKQETQMHFLLGLLFGYYIRGKESSLVATLVVIALLCFIEVPVGFDYGG
jgi:hypothetical protein